MALHHVHGGWGRGGGGGEDGVNTPTKVLLAREFKQRRTSTGSGLATFLSRDFEQSLE